jgi:hypothetical protein
VFACFPYIECIKDPSPCQVFFSKNEIFFQIERFRSSPNSDIRYRLSDLSESGPAQDALQKSVGSVLDSDAPILHYRDLEKRSQIHYSMREKRGGSSEKADLTLQKSCELLEEGTKKGEPFDSPSEIG